MARLASLVPTPRANLTRYHGVFAPNHRLREQVRPARRGRRKAQTTDEPAPARHVSMTWAQRLKRVLLRASCPPPSALRPPPSALRASLRLFRIAPGDLVKIDILTCKHCGGAVKVAAPAHPARAAFVHPCTAAAPAHPARAAFVHPCTASRGIEDSAVIKKILDPLARRAEAATPIFRPFARALPQQAWPGLLEPGCRQTSL